MKQTNTPPRFKRRFYYIDKKFQAKFIMGFWLIVAVGSLLSVAAVHWLAQNSTTVAIINGRVDVHTTAEYLLPLMLQTVFIELLIISLATIFLTLMISHKIAGPLYHLKMTLRSLGDGHLGKINLRHGDQLQDLAVSYNEAITKLNDKVKSLKNASSMDEVKKILNTFS